MNHMNVVVVGHVDHGKSTVIGRLLADTDSLPEGKLEDLREFCKSKARSFEYAFLTDALREERAQGITIDTSRLFFKTTQRNYQIIDAPGHFEFLKNMISGAARADAAFLTIDAKEGITENTLRHAYMLSFLSIQQIAILINKMDLVDNREDVFLSLASEIKKYLASHSVYPKYFIPISAYLGENIARASKQITWYVGPTVLEALDSFKLGLSVDSKPFRLAVQDLYDDVIVGRVSSGTLKVGDEVVAFPGNKRANIKSILGTKNFVAISGQSIGITLNGQIKVKRGDILCSARETLPLTLQELYGNLIWLGQKPLNIGQTCTIKLGTQRCLAKLEEIFRCLHSRNLHRSEAHKKQIQQNEVATCRFSLSSQISFDVGSEFIDSNRFVLVDNHCIAGGGLIIDHSTMPEITTTN
ncbi:MAG: hypothetical protein A4S09_13845 [Proteobacteria bacterium SG_bin7]|nr:MAG: hypothetical protein A4S09_13845 [Proteobacteria bacterium SG_bin7]